jgi:hypothetical protein
MTEHVKLLQTNMARRYRKITVFTGSLTLGSVTRSSLPGLAGDDGEEAAWPERGRPADRPCPGRPASSA